MTHSHLETVEVVVGTISRAHGIRGDLTIDVRTDEPERRFAAGEVLRIQGGSKTLTVESSRWHSGRLLACFENVLDRTQAEALRGTVLVVDAPLDDVPEDPEEFYDHQLVGLKARQGDRIVGEVTAVVHLPSQDLLSIDVDGQERLVPFVSQLVPGVDLTAREVVLADLPGLIDDRADDDGTAAEHTGSGSTESFTESVENPTR